MTPATQSPPAATSTPPPRPGGLATTWLVFGLTLRRGLRGRRLLFTLLFLLLVPALSALVGWAVEAEDHAQFFYAVLGTLHLAVVLPAAALTLASSFPWPEADEGTLTYWFTAPVWRWAVLLGRYLGNLALGMVLLPATVLLTWWPLTLPPDAGDFAVRVVVGTWLAFPAYLAVFTVCAAALRRGIVLGVVFMVVENSLAILRGTIPDLTLVQYARAFVYAAVPAERAAEVAEVYLLDAALREHGVARALVVFSTAPLLALALALTVVHVLEYRSKQETQG